MEYFTTETLFAALLILAEETNTFFSFMTDGGGSVVWVGTEHVRESTPEKVLTWGYKKMFRIAKNQGSSVIQEKVQ